MLRRTGLAFEQVRHDQLDGIALQSDDIAYIHGGGGWIPQWSGTPARTLATLASRHRGRIVIGPSSFSTDREYLRTALLDSLHVAAGRVTVFCRERPSFEVLVPAVGQLAEVVLDHDTALNLTRDEVLAFGEPVGPNRGYRLYALRNDAETRPPGACRVLRAPVDPIGYSYSFKHWVRLHARAGSIVTNRLHSAICGAILGVPTTLLPNSYHKARRLGTVPGRARRAVGRPPAAGLAGRGGRTARHRRLLAAYAKAAASGRALAFWVQPLNGLAGPLRRIAGPAMHRTSRGAPGGRSLPRLVAAAARLI